MTIDVRIVRATHYAEAMTEPRLHTLAGVLKDRRFRETGYSDFGALESSPAPFERRIGERRQFPRGDRHGIFAIPKANPAGLEGSMIIEEDSGYSPLEDDFPEAIMQIREDLGGSKIAFAGHLSTEGEASDFHRIASLIIVEAFDVMIDFGIKLGVIAVNPEKHESFYQLFGFRPVARTDCMKGLTDAPGVLMTVKESDINHKLIGRLKLRFAKAI